MEETPWRDVRFWEEHWQGAQSSAAMSMAGVPPAHASQSNHLMFTEDLVVERDRPGRPHEGKVLAAIQPHADDIPIFAAGTVAKLISEGYTGYLINTTNDDHAGPGTVGDTCVANERDGPRWQRRSASRRFSISATATTAWKMSISSK